MTVHKRHKVVVRTKSAGIFSAMAESDDRANEIAEDIANARPARGLIKLYEGFSAQGDYSLIDTDSIESITVRKVT